MEDGGRRTNNRLVMIGAFASGVVVAAVVLAVVGMLFLDIGGSSDAEVTRSTRSSRTSVQPNTRGNRGYSRWRPVGGAPPCPSDSSG